ncbi:MAG: efflux RND transporter periplasmic adaptor subunit [Ignavibacteriales bacterium]|nr:efflux RND transporter periplasmic adaptor subunit [Ignavibacteriales bacterium]
MEKNKIKLTGLIITAVLQIFFFLCCSSDEPKEQTAKNVEQNKSAEHNEAIKLTDSDLKELGVEIKEAGAGVITNHVDLTGEIKAEPSRLSHIIPRFPGIVKEVYKTVGEKVKQGDVLEVIESNESLTSYEVKSLVDGTIIELHMAKGDLVGGDQVAITVANLDKVWATLNIYQRDINKISVGQRTLVSLSLEEEGEAGTISYVSPVVDEATRTASARVILNNSLGKWRPGMFVSAKVIVNEKKLPLVIEKSALQTLEDKTVVFIKKGDEFFPQQVNTGLVNDVSVEIISGLQPGQQYVSKGSFTLKAEILKESFGGDEH